MPRTTLGHYALGLSGYALLPGRTFRSQNQVLAVTRGTFGWQPEFTELDDIIRYSFGLRWAQMGLFMTYRLAGGEEGMRHFLDQFGPTLSWPWTRLMDVPDLDDALIDCRESSSHPAHRGASHPPPSCIRRAPRRAASEARRTPPARPAPPSLPRNRHRCS